MPPRLFSWFRVLVGAVLGGILGMIVLSISAYVIGALLGGDEPAGTVASILLMYGAPVALAVGAMVGGQGYGYRDRRVFAATGGALLGMIAIFIIAIPVYIVYGGALDRTGVGYLLFYGIPIAIVFGAVQGRRRFGRPSASAPTE
jgi:hypothetical protein